MSIFSVADSRSEFKRLLVEVKSLMQGSAADMEKFERSATRASNAVGGSGGSANFRQSARVRPASSDLSSKAIAELIKVNSSGFAAILNAYSKGIKVVITKPSPTEDVTGLSRRALANKVRGRAPESFDQAQRRLSVLDEYMARVQSGSKQALNAEKQRHSILNSAVYRRGVIQQRQGYGLYTPSNRIGGWQRRRPAARTPDNHTSNLTSTVNQQLSNRSSFADGMADSFSHLSRSILNPALKKGVAMLSSVRLVAGAAAGPIGMVLAALTMVLGKIVNISSKVAAFTGAAVFSSWAYSMYETVNQMKTAEKQVIRLKTAMQSTKLAVDAYQKATVFAARTPSPVGMVVESAAILRTFQFEPFSIADPEDGRNVLEILGDMAGAVGTDLSTATWALYRAQVGQWDIMQNNFQINAAMIPQLKNLSSGTKEYGQTIVEFLSTQDRFRGGMEEMARTIHGLVSNIKDAHSIFFTFAGGVSDSRDVFRGMTLYDSFRAGLRGIYDEISNANIFDQLRNMRQSLASEDREIQESGIQLQAAIHGRLGIANTMIAESILDDSAYQTMQQRMDAFHAQTGTLFSTIRARGEQIQDMGRVFGQFMRMIWEVSGKPVLDAFANGIDTVADRFQIFMDNMTGTAMTAATSTKDLTNTIIDQMTQMGIMSEYNLLNIQNLTEQMQKRLEEAGIESIGRSQKQMMIFMVFAEIAVMWLRERFAAVGVYMRATFDELGISLDNFLPSIDSVGNAITGLEKKAFILWNTTYRFLELFRGLKEIAKGIYHFLIAPFELLLGVLHGVVAAKMGINEFGARGLRLLGLVSDETVEEAKFKRTHLTQMSYDRMKSGLIDRPQAAGTMIERGFGNIGNSITGPTDEMIKEVAYRAARAKYFAGSGYSRNEKKAAETAFSAFEATEVGRHLQSIGIMVQPNAVDYSDPHYVQMMENIAMNHLTQSRDRQDVTYSEPIAERTAKSLEDITNSLRGEALSGISGAVTTHGVGVTDSNRDIAHYLINAAHDAIINENANEVFLKAMGDGIREYGVDWEDDGIKNLISELSNTVNVLDNSIKGIEQRGSVPGAENIDESFHSLIDHIGYDTTFRSNLSAANMFYDQGLIPENNEDILNSLDEVNSSITEGVGKPSEYIERNTRDISSKVDSTNNLLRTIDATLKSHDGSIQDVTRRPLTDIETLRFRYASSLIAETSRRTGQFQEARKDADTLSALQSLSSNAHRALSHDKPIEFFNENSRAWLSVGGESRRDDELSDAYSQFIRILGQYQHALNVQNGSSMFNGSWNTSEGLHYLHNNEMVIPSSVASKIRANTVSRKESFDYGFETSTGSPMNASVLSPEGQVDRSGVEPSTNSFNLGGVTVNIYEPVEDGENIANIIGSSVVDYVRDSLAVSGRQVLV